ncbi:hypothetical protein TNCV_520411 [Trichonephila clavipes]|nr:hypothetical protein TNCV_520411 [Trichonephila clavipes]
MAEDSCEIETFESLEIIQLDIEDINQRIETTEISQQEDARGEWENLPPKTEKSQYQKEELVATVRTQFGNKLKPWTLH